MFLQVLAIFEGKTPLVPVDFPSNPLNLGLSVGVPYLDRRRTPLGTRATSCYVQVVKILTEHVLARKTCYFRNIYLEHLGTNRWLDFSSELPEMTQLTVWEIHYSGNRLRECNFLFIYFYGDSLSNCSSFHYTMILSLIILWTFIWTCTCNMCYMYSCIAMFIYTFRSNKNSSKIAKYTSII